MAPRETCSALPTSARRSRGAKTTKPTSNTPAMTIWAAILRNKNVGPGPIERGFEELPRVGEKGRSSAVRSCQGNCGAREMVHNRELLSRFPIGRSTDILQIPDRWA